MIKCPFLQEIPDLFHINRVTRPDSHKTAASAFFGENMYHNPWRMGLQECENCSEMSLHTSFHEKSKTRVIVGSEARVNKVLALLLMD